MTGSERLISLACRLCSISNDPQPPCSLRAAQALIINLDDIDDIRSGDGSIAELLIGCDSTVRISQDRARGIRCSAQTRGATSADHGKEIARAGVRAGPRARIVKRRDGERQRGQSEPIFILVDEADQCIKFARAVYGAPWTYYVAEPVPVVHPCRPRLRQSSQRILHSKLLGHVRRPSLNRNHAGTIVCVKLGRPVKWRHHHR